jgi:hypothetical protein
MVNLNAKSYAKPKAAGINLTARARAQGEEVEVVERGRLKL